MFFLRRRIEDDNLARDKRINSICAHPHNKYIRMYLAYGFLKPCSVYIRICLWAVKNSRKTYVHIYPERKSAAATLCAERGTAWH